MHALTHFSRALHAHTTRAGRSLTRAKTTAQARAALEAAAEVEAKKSIPGSAIFKAAFA